MPEAIGDIRFSKLEAKWVNRNFPEKVTAELSRAVTKETGVNAEEVAQALIQAGRLVQDFISKVAQSSGDTQHDTVRGWCRGIGQLSRDELALAGALFLRSALNTESVIPDPESGISRFVDAAQWQAIERNIWLSFMNIGKHRIGADNTGVRGFLPTIAENIAGGPSDKSPILKERIVTRDEEEIREGRKVLVKKDVHLVGGDPEKDEDWIKQDRRIGITVVQSTVIQNILHENDDLGSRAENLAARMRGWFEKDR